MCALQSSTEAEEEYITNTLMKRIEGLKHEKQDLLTKLEAEEEMITNQLQRKLNQLQKEKIQMEITLEQEQECMVNRLQKQLDDLRGPLTPRSRLASAESKSSLMTGPSMSSLAGGKWHSGASLSDIGPSTTVIEMLRAEVIFVDLEF
jgi:predicted nuclease with TOPRIM domain